MPYQPIQWANRSVEGRQVEADGSRLLNFYAAQVSPASIDRYTPKVPVMLYSTPGLRRYLNVPNRAAVHNGVTVDASPAKGCHGLLSIINPAYDIRLFGLIGQYFFFTARYGSGLDVPLDYNPTNGDAVIELQEANIIQFSPERDEAIPAGRPSKIVTDGRRILFASENEVYVYDLGRSGGAGFITVNTPAVADLSTLEDLQSNDWIDVGWVDGFFLLAAKSGQFFHSQLDSVQFDQLDFAEAGTNPDEIVGMEILNRRIYIIGRDTVELWFNAGGADFAFSRDNSFTLQIGCVAKGTIASNLLAIMFLGTDGIVYAMSGAQSNRISTESVEYDVARSNPQEARAYTYTEEGHRFYSLVLDDVGGSKKNWTYDFNTGVWHERSETDIICIERFGNRNLVGKEGFDHIFDQRLDWGSVDDDANSNSAVNREAISPVLFRNFQRMNMSQFQVDIPLKDGGVPEDYILVDWSDDAQQNWVGSTNMDGTERRLLLDRGPRFRVNRMGQTVTGRNIRLRTSARRRVDVLGAYITTDTLPT